MVVTSVVGMSKPVCRNASDSQSFELSELGISLASVLVGNPTGAVGSPSLVIETIEAISELKSTMGDVIDTLEGVVQQFQAISTVINSLDQATKDTENNIHTILSGDFDVVAYAQR